jgi:hypothetical protein
LLCAGAAFEWFVFYHGSTDRCGFPPFSLDSTEQEVKDAVLDNLAREEVSDGQQHCACIMRTKQNPAEEQWHLGGSAQPLSCKHVLGSCWQTQQ